MKRFLLILLLAVAVVATVQVPRAEARPYPVRVGVTLNHWGWIPWYGVWSPYGYSFWGYYNYLPRYATYGALAYDATTDAAGWSYNSANRWAAERAAVAYCGTANCRSVVWVQGGCAAISTAKESTHLGWALHPTKWGAIQRAQHECRRQRGQGCRTRAWVCSY